MSLEKTSPFDRSASPVERALATPLPTSRMELEEQPGGVSVRWRTFRGSDAVHAPFGLAWCAGSLYWCLTTGRSVLAEGAAPWMWPILGAVLGVGVMSGRAGLRALGRWFERVELRVGGRQLSVRRGPFSRRSRVVLEGKGIRRLRSAWRRASFLERVIERTRAHRYTLVALLKRGEEVVLVDDLDVRSEPEWLAYVLTRVLDLSEPPESVPE